MLSRLPPVSQWLAVAAIVALIAAIFVPVLTRHVDRDPRLSCLSNERQLWLGLIQYVQDNDNMMPGFADAHGGTWRTDIYPYVKNPNLYQCPQRDKDDRAANPSGADGYAQSYAANASGGRGAFNGPGVRPVALAAVPEPADLIALMETAHNTNPGYDIDNPAGFGPRSKTLWAGHGGRSDYTFLDGHVKALRPLETVGIDPNGGVVINRPNGGGAINRWYRNGALPLSANGVAVLRDAQARFGP